MSKRPFVVDATLTAVAIGYSNPADTLIADEVMPRTQVSQESFKWTKYPLEDGFSVEETLVGRKGKVNEVEFTGTEEDSSVQDHGLDAPVVNSDVEVAAAARAKGLSTFDPEARAVAGLTNRLQLAREVRVANIVQSLATYSAARRVTLAGTGQLSDFVNSDPIATFNTALEGTLVYRPNTVVMGQAGWSTIRRHPVLVNAIRGNLTNKGIITRAEFEELFEIKKLLIGSSYVNTAKKGQAATLARCWGKHVACLYINPDATTQEGITFGFTAQFGTKIAGRVDDPDIGLQGGYRVRSGERVRELVVAQDVGYFIQNAVA